MRREHKTLLIQALLFVATVVTTTLAGAEWTYGKSIFIAGYTWADFASGLSFSIPFLLILTVHEFGHYFTARYHSISSSLPYYLPLPPIPFSLGTLGAVIRIRERMQSTRQDFDIGVSGPLAGFVMALIVLFYGFTHLPEPDYIFSIHPEYKAYGADYPEKVYKTGSEEILDIRVGGNLLFAFFSRFVADPERMPNPHEIMHYPFLFAGFLSLVFTSINLLPIGQLDGGRVLYGMFGSRVHRVVARVVFIAFLYYGCVGLIDVHSVESHEISWWLKWLFIGGLFLYTALQGLRQTPANTAMFALVILASLLLFGFLFPNVHGYSGYLAFVLVIGRFVGVDNPPALIEQPLDSKRIVLGWIAVVVLIITFSPYPLE